MQRYSKIVGCDLRGTAFVELTLRIGDKNLSSSGKGRKRIRFGNLLFATIMIFVNNDVNSI